MLANAPTNPILTKWSDNVRIFDSMAEYHIISLTECEKLKSCYVTLRNKIHHLNLLGNPVIVDDSEFMGEFFLFFLLKCLIKKSRISPICIKILLYNI